MMGNVDHIPDNYDIWEQAERERGRIQRRYQRELELLEIGDQKYIDRLEEKEEWQACMN